MQVFTIPGLTTIFGLVGILLVISPEHALIAVLFTILAWALAHIWDILSDMDNLK